MIPCGGAQAGSRELAKRCRGGVFGTPFAAQDIVIDRRSGQFDRSNVTRHRSTIALGYTSILFRQRDTDLTATTSFFLRYASLVISRT
jgi:hypothetical protein